jgi:poly(3-hydroxybutyrate) depolymerase
MTEPVFPRHRQICLLSVCLWASSSWLLACGPASSGGSATGGGGAGSGDTTGTAGTTGMAGTTGAAGTMGIAGTTGAAGATGVAGTTGGASPVGGRGGASGRGGTGATAGTGGGGIAGVAGGQAGRGGSGAGAGKGGAGGGGSGAAGSGVAGTAGSGACPSNGWAPGKQTINTQWGGVARQYVVYIPKSYKGTSSVPLMMVIHGAHNTPALVEGWSQMDAVSDQNGFIVVYPAALDCWKVGTTVLPGCTTADDDVGFLNNVVVEAESHACIDQKRVYVTGISNGSLMSQYMGCHFADTFAAVGGVAGGQSCTSPARPLPIFYVLGTADMTVGWDNGSNALNWAKRENCNTTPVTVYNEGSTSCTVYQGCDQGVQVEFCAVTGMPHCWPDNCYLDPKNMMFQAFKASPPMWQFFSQYSLP